MNEHEETYYCSDPTCENYNTPVENAGTPENEFYNCPIDDKPLRKDVKVDFKATLSPSADLG